MKIHQEAYRVYRVPDGCGEEFCGEFESLDEAQAMAEREPSGLDEYLWATARAAGHVAGLTAPEGGVEDELPTSWHGEEGWHCVVRVQY